MTIPIHDDLIGLVSEFLHREVGEPEDDAVVDATTLLTLIRGWEEDQVSPDAAQDMVATLSELTDWFWVFYDEDMETQPRKWHVSFFVGGKDVSVHRDDYTSAMQEAISLCSTNE